MAKPNFVEYIPENENQRHAYEFAKENFTIETLRVISLGESGILICDLDSGEDLSLTPSSVAFLRGVMKK